MSFISYAQNFEDVMLWRALKHVDKGFYIDVGANDPEIDSVTKAFYDRGWRGINIEPIEQWFLRLEAQRPRDINLQIAAGAQQGKLVIYELPDTGLSTVERATAERHEAERGYSKIERSVPVETLTSICQRFHLAPIHFLKIDVEGAEKDVLQGIDFSTIRPWIIVVESTLPNTQTEDYVRWEPIVCSANYEYVYFDGLNRYYVAREHCELKDSFTSPPNVFDAFVSRQQLDSELRAQVAEGEAEAAESRATKVETELATVRKELHEIHQSNRHHLLLSEQRAKEIEALRASLSWRATALLRWLAAPALRKGSPATVPPAPGLVDRAIRWGMAQPQLVAFVHRSLHRYPKLRETITQHVATAMHATVVPQQAPAATHSGDPVRPTSRARQIYADLKSAIERQEAKD